ncbi:MULTISPECIES: aldo/keto reductase [unclassified Sphingobium]|uniref:aldo/keto reductase n=1 Tax=unclassified Sphingobium TaxID=2611147 RepID=UPI0022240F01|nr:MULTISPECIES: aldo/keto reductase [unclassified Sphingobium]MCW2381789.1 aryl-alcohol dehydrogenase-like predicted oxidoreductase [Sphingobium sp. B2D3B]MCW2398105.1 aryl-alcohol dehydrogenase-like predicted oxidoreductase [Sphingobium sp. B2D3C]
MTSPSTPLPTRRIADMAVSAISLGCMNLSHAYDAPPSEEEGARLLNHALDIGVTHLDSAALYGGGKNEGLIARAVGHRRKDFVLSSKCVLDLIDGERVLDGRPETITGSLERSLKRLDTDFIDLYYMHRLDRNVPIEDSMGALVRAKEAGKIGAIGLSEMSAASIRRAHAVHPIAAIQSEYSPWVRNPEVAVLDACRDLDIAFVAFSPVARGMLAGAISSIDFKPGDIRIPMPRFQEPNFSHNLKLAERFNAVAADLGITPAQLSLAWGLARAPQIIAIPGTRSIAHLEENVKAASITLTPESVAAVDAIFAPGAVAGARYPAPVQKQIDTELLPEEADAA